VWEESRKILLIFVIRTLKFGQELLNEKQNMIIENELYIEKSALPDLLQVVVTIFIDRTDYLTKILRAGNFQLLSLWRYSCLL
jgi:hypothetical protein